MFLSKVPYFLTLETVRLARSLTSGGLMHKSLVVYEIRDDKLIYKRDLKDARTSISTPRTFRMVAFPLQ